jgi:hypothetical protein
MKDRSILSHLKIKPDFLVASARSSTGVLEECLHPIQRTLSSSTFLADNSLVETSCRVPSTRCFQSCAHAVRAGGPVTVRVYEVPNNFADPVWHKSGSADSCKCLQTEDAI